ncbi:MAG: hypothetical protein JSU63_03955 [Phycisphaerales bacterium]|nr:MAG: hypothetical protein JSU63_03955 [Phycisphaerales bacterium]
MAIETQTQKAPDDGNREGPADLVKVLDSLGFAVFAADRDGKITYRNALAKADWQAGEEVDTVFHDVAVLGQFERWDTAIGHTASEEKALQFDCALGASDAVPPRLLEIHLMPLRGEDSTHVTGTVILVQETARPPGIEEKIEVSQRLASLGKLAARVAHELNNPLDGILRYVNLAMRAATDIPEPRLKSYLAESRTGLMRMVQIIGDLLEFSRTTDGQFDEMDINQVVEQAIRSTASAAEANRVVVTADFQTTDMPAMYGSRLYQVCCNLLKNAIEVMPDGGRVSVTTGIVDDEIIIEVADTGIGLPTPAEKVFQPFFTTKEAGKGTGLGLAICKDFVEDMKGTISAGPNEEKGALFSVRIPTSSCHRPSPLADSRTGRPSASSSIAQNDSTAQEGL